MSQTKTINVSLVSPLTLLTIVFVVLKAMDKIDWSWWLVLAPTWVPMAFGLGLIFLGLIATVIGALLK